MLTSNGWLMPLKENTGDELAMVTFPSAVIFFFSSRRRHTRCGRDWSSDVCSSDLEQLLPGRSQHGVAGEKGQRSQIGTDHETGSQQQGSQTEHRPVQQKARQPASGLADTPDGIEGFFDIHQIGRASCRERAWMSAV